MYTLMLVAFMTKPEEVYQLWSEVIVVRNTVTILVTMSDEVKINLWFKACRDILNKGN